MKNDIMSLPPDNRAKLAHDLIKSLDEKTETDLAH